VSAGSGYQPARGWVYSCRYRFVLTANAGLYAVMPRRFGTAREGRKTLISGLEGFALAAAFFRARAHSTARASLGMRGPLAL